ncbi:hypothetical protein CDEST_07842 [Colletotrichum destructivum]|uniref:Uncharacterized protein n=1 Tax=Colletotrichum destructivum TaxID=34406 RepID=A0AAX4IIH3_9PEZI|nr:hypothetical protein CDEST_07842 [Colletotrichum destructivum]
MGEREGGLSWVCRQGNVKQEEPEIRKRIREEGILPRGNKGVCPPLSCSRR